MHSILIIEDERAIAQLYETKLKLHEYSVSVAYNGLEGFRKLYDLVPDLILLDLRMPVMSGEKFLEKVRKSEKFKNIPVIILTNINRNEAPQTIWHLGISGYFIKAHHTPSYLLAIVDKHLRGDA